MTQQLYQMACEENLDLVEKLLKRGAPAHAISERTGRSHLHNALERNNTDIARVLLEHGAKADARDKDGMTPLHWAAQQGYETVIEALPSTAGFARDNDGNTPLNLAVTHNRPEAMKALTLAEEGDTRIFIYNTDPIPAVIAALEAHPNTTTFRKDYHGHGVPYTTLLLEAAKTCSWCAWETLIADVVDTRAANGAKFLHTGLLTGYDIRWLQSQQYVQSTIFNTVKLCIETEEITEATIIIRNMVNHDEVEVNPNYALSIAIACKQWDLARNILRTFTIDPYENIVTNLHTTADHNIISILKQCGGDVHPNILQAIEDYTACDEAIPQFATGYYSKLIEDLNIIRCNIEKAELYISEVDIGAGAGGAGAGTHGDSSSDLLGNHGDHHSGEFDTA